MVPEEHEAPLLLALAPPSLQPWIALYRNKERRLPAPRFQEAVGKWHCPGEVALGIEAVEASCCRLGPGTLASCPSHPAIGWCFLFFFVFFLEDPWSMWSIAVVRRVLGPERGSSWLNPPQKKGTGLGPRIKWLLHRDGWVGRDEDKENNATSHSPPPGLWLWLWSFPKSA